jgi:hypothetical protein
VKATPKSRLLYLIQCHKNAEQVILLIESLSITNKDHVVVHIDAKSTDVKAQLIQYFANTAKVSVMLNSMDVIWSDLSQVKATLSMLQFAKAKNIIYDYAVLLSGEDVFIKTSEQFKQFLLQKNSSFVERVKGSVQKQRIFRYHFYRRSIYNRKSWFKFISKLILLLQSALPKRNNFRSEQIYKGSSWVILKNTHVDYVLEQVKHHAFLDKFRFTTCADEHFFQIALFNSEYKNEVKPFNLHYIEFDKHSSSPNYLNIHTINNLKERPNYYFARKVTQQTMITKYRASKPSST